MMLMLSLDDAVNVARRLVKDEMDDVTIIRQELEQKCWFLPKSDDAEKRRNDGRGDRKTAERGRQIEADNLKNGCEISQVEMKMAMGKVPCWSGGEPE